jgi:hypothetical protein
MEHLLRKAGVVTVRIPDAVKHCPVRWVRYLHTQLCKLDARWTKNIRVIQGEDEGSGEKFSTDKLVDL